MVVCLASCFPPHLLSNYRVLSPLDMLTRFLFVSCRFFFCRCASSRANLAVSGGSTSGCLVLAVGGCREGQVAVSGVSFSFPCGMARMDIKA